ncbi:MAG TPA: ribonuclease HII [Candidatus Saccharimonadales bacterium]|nr:ribonuclease HII [Candidatus Saccharimonadales bacterium]
MILGIDEVGRGPWAGPLVVGAVVLGGATIEGLTDSKKLTKKRREELDIVIRQQVNGYGLGWVNANEIDEIGLSAALVLATKRAVEQVKTPYSEIIIDGTINFLKDTSKGRYVKTLKKADLLIPSVSAASIIAKVARDNYMAEQDTTYPGFGFKSHVGYGTAMHRAAIEALGVTPLHRLSFAPLHKYHQPVKPTSSISSAERYDLPSTKLIGDAAETEVTDYLKRSGHTILDRNWKTKYCEIDIVSQAKDIIYFTEVKYRKKSDQGGGLAAITPKKLRQMRFAAEFYALTYKISDTNLRLAVASVTGENLVVEQFLEVV